MFPRLSMAKIEAGVSNGPAVKHILKYAAFRDTLSVQHRDAFAALQNLVENFLGNKKAPNHVELVKDYI